MCDEPTIPLESQLTHQELPPNTLIIPDDLKSPPTNEEINLHESPRHYEEIDEIRPPSPTCSSTDEYDEFPDSESEQPVIQSPDDSVNEPDQEYERPPLDWSDMDPATESARNFAMYLLHSSNALGFVVFLVMASYVLGTDRLL